MSARDDLAESLGYAEIIVGASIDDMLDAYRSEVLREAAEWFDRYSVGDIDAGAQLRRMAKEQL